MEANTDLDNFLTKIESIDINSMAQSDREYCKLIESDAKQILALHLVLKDTNEKIFIANGYTIDKYKVDRNPNLTNFNPYLDSDKIVNILKESIESIHATYINNIIRYFNSTYNLKIEFYNFKYDEKDITNLVSLDEIYKFIRSETNGVNLKQLSHTNYLENAVDIKTDTRHPRAVLKGNTIIFNNISIDWGCSWNKFPYGCQERIERIFGNIKYWFNYMNDSNSEYIYSHHKIADCESNKWIDYKYGGILNRVKFTKSSNTMVLEFTSPQIAEDIIKFYNS